MLAVIKYQLENPEDIPSIPHAAAEFLKARTNFAYLTRVGALDDLRRAGWTEAAILGFAEGAQLVTELIEQMDAAQMQHLEDQQVT
ncbi:phage protein [Pseudomonas sp. SID14000]|uniref:phage protein n=1 Tax=Pseudomonas sp. SID14000 TaxID=1986221 RepID=UPI000B3C650F|nr:phage protein [Pseudomonas sp. SID14000]